MHKVIFHVYESMQSVNSYYIIILIIY